MGKKQVLTTLPPGNYSVSDEPKQVLTELPKGNYSIQQPDRSSGSDYTGILAEQADSNKVEDLLDSIQNDPNTKGGMLDSEKDVLRDLLTNPSATEYQKQEGINTMKSGDFYYIKKTDNGVSIPVRLNYGERPPKGYDVAKVWGNAKEAKDDSWYTDLGKSLVNGVLGAAEGVVNLAQLGTMAVTGEESKYLNNLANTANVLKFEKDEDLNRPVYNTEGIEKWSDLVNKDRFDLSPEALWGTLNMAAESVTSFMGGAKGAANVAKGVKGVAELSKGGQKAAAFTGSYITQLGDNLENAKEAGLTGRDAAAFAGLTTSIQAAIDAQFGLESKIFQGAGRKSANDLMRELGKTVEKDAAGKITERGFKELAKNTTLSYGKFAQSVGKEIAKGALQEGAQEASQDFVGKAAEQLWDKMSDEDKAKFGTNALSPEAFGSYIQNGLAGIISGAPMSVAATNYRQKYEEQSINALQVVQKGPEAVDELKQNLKIAKDKGHISLPEYEQAVFKIDAYSAYNEQTKDLDLSEEEKKKTFETSFNIEALKSEIPKDKEVLDKLDPIALAKIESKKELIKGLQNDLKEIVLKADVKKETKVGQDTINKQAKDLEPKETPDATHDDILRKYGVSKSERETKVPKEETAAPPVESDEEIQPEVKVNKPERTEKRNAVPKFDAKDDKGVYEFNKMTDALRKKQALHDYFDDNPQLNNEIEGRVVQAQNNVWKVDLGDGRYMQFARSISEEYKGNTANLPEGGTEERMDSDGRPYVEYKTPVGVRLENIKSDTVPSGRKRVVNIYNKQTGKHIIFGKELDKGGSKYSPFEVQQLTEIKNKDNREAFTPPTDIVPVKEEKAPEKPKKSVKTPKKRMTPSDREAEERDYLQNRPLSEQEVAEELIKEAAREEVFAREGVLYDKSDKETSQKDLKEINDKLDQLKKLKSKSAAKVIGSIINEIEDDGVKKFAQAIIDNSDKLDFVKFKLSKHNQGGLYLPTGGDLIINTNPNAFSSADHINKIIIHEYLHAFTTNAISNQKTEAEKLFYKEIKSVYEELKKDTKYPDEYGFSNVYEFVSELASKPDFVAKLKERNRSIFQKIIDAIKKLFGIQTDREKLVDKGIDTVLNFIPTSTPKKVYNVDRLKAPAIKNLEDMTASELAKKTTKSLESYRADVLGRPLEQIRQYIKYIDEALKSDKFNDEQKDALRAAKDNIKREEGRDKAKWIQYKEDVQMISSIMSEGKLEDMPMERLIEMYNLMTLNFQDAAKEERFKQVMQQIAYRMFVERKEELKQYKKFVEEQANKQDLAPKDVLMKTLSHMTENFPELQTFSKMFDNAHFDMVKDRYDLKTQLETLGKEVIKEKNKKLGIVEKGLGLFSSNSAKYFDFVEHPDGRYYTVEEAEKKGYSAAQMKFLKFMHKLNDLRNEQLASMGENGVNTEVLKVDKGLQEAFKTEGLLQAFSSYLGNGYNIRNVRVNYNGKPMSYGEIEKMLVKEGEGGAANKVKSLLKMAKYQLEARRQLKKGVNVDEKENPLAKQEGSEYQLSTDGRLKSKFNKPRDKDRGYSKDFYAAAFSFIDDYTHVKFMTPLLPYINSIEHINKVGFGEHGAKNNVAEWVNQWKDLHIFKKDKQGALGPELDTFMKMIRRLTSLAVMAFNVPAAGWNAAMGTYNNLRAETFKEVARGSKRLIKDGVLSKKAKDILNKYQVVSLDYDSNPKLYAGRLFDMLAHGLTRAGEYYVQGSMFLGYLTPEEYNSFEYKDVNGVKELVVKPGVDEKALQEKMISYKNRVSDIQGKYSNKDQRNYMAGEFGKLVGQFKTWLPDAARIRFGKEYIDRDGITRSGSYRTFIGQGFKDLKADIKENGIKGLTENKNAMANIKGLMLVAAFMAIRLGADDDEKKRKKGDAIDQALGNLLYIFDIDQLKFTVKNPIAALGTLNSFVNVMEDALNLDAKKGLKHVKKVLPYNKVIDVSTELLPEE